MALAELHFEPAERTEQRECETHGTYTATLHQLRPNGRWHGGRCPECDKIAKQAALDAEARDAAARKQRDIEDRFDRSMIPLRFQEKTFAGYKAETLGQQRALKFATRYAENFKDRFEQGGGMVFCGKPGTGKSHLAAAIANHIIPTGASALWLTVMQAVRSVKETWGREAERTEAQAIAAMLNPDLLILDEVGVQFGSEAERIILFEIINGRYQELRPTILISNLPESDLGEYLGERVLDRMREGGGAVVAFDWDSYRK